MKLNFLDSINVGGCNLVSGASGGFHVLDVFALRNGESSLELTGRCRFVSKKRNQEHDEAGNWYDNSGNLPEYVKITVRFLDVSSSGHNEESVHSPWEDVLNGEAPPELEESVSEPVPLSFIAGKHVSADGSAAGEENFLVPDHEANLSCSSLGGKE